MLVNEKYTHGGEVNKAIYLDFSINVNPLGMPGNVKECLIREVGQAERYPDATCGALMEKLSEKHHIGKEWLILGNGADELIYAYARALKELYGVKKVLLFAPTFGEYERALSGEEIEICYVKRGRDFKIGKAELNCFRELVEKISVDAVFLCSPDNPSGQLIEKEVLEEILAETKKRGIRCFLDLCFYELTEQYDSEWISGLVEQNGHLTVISAFTKTYAVAGLRLGYLMSDDANLISFISKHTQCWNISSLAQVAGVACLENEAYVNQAREVIRKERAYLQEELGKRVAYVCPSNANYILCFDEYPYAAKLRDCGILIRDCSNYYGLTEGYFRVAVRSHEENVKLMEAMEACRGK